MICMGNDQEYFDRNKSYKPVNIPAAIFTFAFFTSISSPIDAPEFLRIVPSILIIPRPISDWDDTTVAAVVLDPLISIKSPSSRLYNTF